MMQQSRPHMLSGGVFSAEDIENYRAATESNYITSSLSSSEEPLKGNALDLTILTGDTGGEVCVLMIDPTEPVAATEATGTPRGRRRTDSPPNTSRSSSVVGNVIDSVRRELGARWQRHVEGQRQESSLDTTMTELQEAQRYNISGDPTPPSYGPARSVWPQVVRPTLRELMEEPRNKSEPRRMLFSELKPVTERMRLK